MQYHWDPQEGHTTEPAWMVHYEYKGMTSYYRMYDLLKGQRLLYELIEQILYGNVYTKTQLNPNTKIFQMPEKNKTEKESSQILNHKTDENQRYHNTTHKIPTKSKKSPEDINALGWKWNQPKRIAKRQSGGECKMTENSNCRKKNENGRFHYPWVSSS